MAEATEVGKTTETNPFRQEVKDQFEYYREIVPGARIVYPGDNDENRADLSSEDRRFYALTLAWSIGEESNLDGDEGRGKYIEAYLDEQQDTFIDEWKYTDRKGEAAEAFECKKETDIARKVIKHTGAVLRVIYKDEIASVPGHVLDAIYSHAKKNNLEEEVSGLIQEHFPETLTDKPVPQEEFETPALGELFGADTDDPQESEGPALPDVGDDAVTPGDAQDGNDYVQDAVPDASADNASNADESNGQRHDDMPEAKPETPKKHPTVTPGRVTDPEALRRGIGTFKDLDLRRLTPAQRIAAELEAKSILEAQASGEVRPKVTRQHMQKLINRLRAQRIEQIVREETQQEEKKHRSKSYSSY